MILEHIEFNEAKGWALGLQGLYDIIPTVLFLLGTIILLKELYSKMVKGNYALLAAGSIMVFSAGVLKALHKILMGFARIDYIILDKQFSPTQSIGFALLFIALLGMFTPYNTKNINSNNNANKASLIAFPAFLVFLEASTALTPYESSLPFIIIMIIGALGFLVMLIIISAKMKKVPEIVLFAVAIVAMIAMGYLSSKHYYDTAWIQISVNIVYQCCFYIGCLLLKKHNLKEAKLF